MKGRKMHARIEEQLVGRPEHERRALVQEMHYIMNHVATRPSSALASAIMSLPNFSSPLAKSIYEGGA